MPDRSFAASSDFSPTLGPAIRTVLKPFDIYGTNNDDSIDLTDQIPGTGWYFNVHLGEGDDEAYGSEHGDRIDGGPGDDQLWGNGGNDQLYGGDDEDELHGGAGNDYLDGGTKGDTLWATPATTRLSAISARTNCTAAPATMC